MEKPLNPKTVRAAFPPDQRYSFHFLPLKMTDASQSEKSNRSGGWSEYINLRVDIIQKLTGEKREAILKRWIRYFDGHDELIEALKTAKHGQDMDDKLQILERNVDFDLIWMAKYVDAVSKLDKLYWELYATTTTINHLESEKRMRELQLSAPALFPDYSESKTIKDITTPTAANQGFQFLGELVNKKARITLSHLRRVLFDYKRLKLTRWLGRFALRVFWSLVIFTLLIGGITNLLPLLLSITFSIGVWVLVEFVGQPWLQKRLDDKYRLDLVNHVGELYIARWEAYVALEEASFNLNKAMGNLRELVKTTSSA